MKKLHLNSVKLLKRGIAVLLVETGFNLVLASCQYEDILYDVLSFLFLLLLPSRRNKSLLQKTSSLLRSIDNK